MRKIQSQISLVTARSNAINEAEWKSITGKEILICKACGTLTMRPRFVLAN